MSAVSRFGRLPEQMTVNARAATGCTRGSVLVLKNLMESKELYVRVLV